MALKSTSIRFKLFIALSTFSTVLVVAGGYLTAAYFTGAMKSQLEKQLGVATCLVANAVDDKLLTYLGSLNSVAAAVPDRAVRDPAAAFVWLNDRKGTRRLFDRGLILVTPRAEILAEFPVAAENGGLVREIRPFIAGIVASGKATLAMPITTMTRQRPLMIMASPCVDSRGRVKAVLMGSVSLLKDSFLSQLLMQRIGTSGYLYLFDLERTLLMHPVRSRILKRDVKPGANRLFDRAIEGFEGSGETVTSRGVRVLSSFRRLKTAPWIVASNLPVSEAYQPIHRFRNLVAVCVGIALVGSMLMALLISGRLTSRLRAFTEHIQSFPDRREERGAFEIGGNDEVSVMARSFNGMVRRLEEHEKRLVQSHEAAMRGEQERTRILHDLQQISKSIPGAFFKLSLVANGSFAFSYVSQGMEELCGVGLCQIYGDASSFFSLIHREDLFRVIKLLRSALMSQNTWNDAFRIVHPQGGETWIEGIASTETLADGTVVWYGYLSDITERKRAEHALGESEKRFRAMFENFPAAYLSLDGEGRVVDVNPELCELLACSREEITGRPFREFYRDGAQGGFNDVFCELATSGWLHREATLARRSGGSVSVLVEGRVQRNVSGAFNKAHCLLIDLSVQKEAERQLENARAAAEAASRAKSEFLANMSHEIRTPLNGVIGMASLLLTTDLPTKQKECAEIIHNSGSTLLALLNDILDLAKIEAYRVELERLDFDLYHLMDDIVEAFSLQVSEKGLELLVFMEGDIPRLLRGDSGRLRQILLNLIGNAIKFSSSGEIDVRILVDAESDVGTFLRFSVSDSGIGIPADRVETLFTPFTQVDSTTTRRFGGTGLGLAICRQLAELMGGTIGVQSTEGSGSTFTVCLPFEKRSSLPPPVPLREELDGCAVLVVDGNDSSRAMIGSLLASRGCQVSTCGDGSVALNLLLDAAGGEAPFRAVLVNATLGDMGGDELGTLIRRRPELGGVMLLLLSPITGFHGDDSPFDEVITKPVRREALVEAVRRGASWACRREGTAMENGEKGTEQQGNGCRVLLVEDNEVNQLVLSSMLEKLGYLVDQASDGREALHALETAPYDAVIMDCMMPVMDGLETTARIRRGEAGEAHRSVPVIASTSFALSEYRQKCLDVGMTDYLAKPFTLEKLSALMARWVRPRHHGPEGAEGDRTTVRSASLQALEELDRLLYEGNSRALEAVRRLGEMAEFDHGVLATLERLIYAYEFDAARKHLVTLTQSREA